MDVEDTTKTDTRTETSDKPASQERPYTPPPDNPGSPGQPSRLESLRRAREQQKSRSQETQDTDTDSPPHEGRDDKVTTEQTGSGNEKTETSGKPEAGDQDRREDDDRPGTDQPGRHDKREQEPSSQDEGTTDARQPDSGTPGNRDRPQAQTAEQRADTRAEPADRPASPERHWTPPPDNPGSPGQPSRLESLARAREQQEARARQSQGTDTGSRPTEQHDNQPVPAQSEDDGVKAGPAGKVEDVGDEHDAGERPSRLEAAETRDESASEGPLSWEGTELPSAGPGNVEPVRDTPRLGESGEAATDVPGAASGPGVQTGREDNVEPATAGRPRAESITRAIERQKAEGEQVNAPETVAPLAQGAGAGAGQQDAPGTGNRPDDGGEAGRPHTGDDRTGAETHENGEPSKAGASERTDAEAAQPARPDGPGRHPNPENPGATDGAEPTAAIREPVAAEAGEPRPETDGPEVADGAEAGAPAPQERPDAGPLAEPDWEGADQPAERTHDLADEGEAAPPEGEAARGLGQEGDDTERADEHEGPESSSEGEEGANEVPDGPGGNNDDHGKNAEDQPESPESEEDNPVIYRIRMPDGQEFGPPDTDRWVFHRGRLDPINENQDLFEPDPEDGDRMRRVLRAARENPDDAEKNLDDWTSDMIKALDKPLPGKSSSSQDTRPQMDHPQGGQQQDLKMASAIVGAAVAAMVIMKAANVASEKAKNSRRSRDDDGD